MKRRGQLMNVPGRPILAEFGHLVDHHHFELRTCGEYDWRGWYEEIGINDFVFIYREENGIGEATFSISDGVTGYYGNIEQIASLIYVPTEGTTEDFISVADIIVDLTDRHVKLKGDISHLIINDARRAYARSVQEGRAPVVG